MKPELQRILDVFGVDTYSATPASIAQEIIHMIVTSERFSPEEHCRHIKSYMNNWLTNGDLIRLYN